MLTASNMLFGIFSILLTFSGRIDLAPYPIFLGALFDFLDGFVARLLNQQSQLGKQLDSLADMITFGLAPGLMMMGVFIQYQFDMQMNNKIDLSNFSFIWWVTDLLDFKNSYLIPFTALLIPIFSMFRLAKFNLDSRQSDSFIGVPTPANTIFFCMFPLILAQDFAFGSFQFQVREFIMQVWVLIPIIIIMSILLVAEIPLFSFKFKHFKWKGNEIRYLFLITCSLLIPLTRFWSMGIIVLLYLILSVIENLLKAKKHEIQS